MSESSVNNEVTYSENKMIRLNTNHNYKTEFYFNDKGLINIIKVFRGDVLNSNMSFVYDAQGNCISGTGPIDEGSFDSTTSNINLRVVYDDKEKHPIFNQFFEYDILSTGQGFFNLKEILIMQQGNRHAREIEWFEYSDYTYKEVYNNHFDKDGYVSSSELSNLSNYSNYGKITYTWN